MEESNSKPSETQELQEDTVELKICVNGLGSLVIWLQEVDVLNNEDWNTIMTNVMNYTKELIHDMQRKG